MLSTVFVCVFLVAVLLVFPDETTNSQIILLQNFGRSTAAYSSHEVDFANSEDLPFFNLEIIMAATDGFSDLNKIGQGGFGTVYKVIY